MDPTRDLDWDGCFNVRDLGGLETRDGGTTRFRRIVRADSLDDLTQDGWRELERYGIRTIVDLRNDDERDQAAIAARPSAVTTVHVALDAIDATDFWKDWSDGPQFGTPLYYRPHMERFPERTRAAIEAIAHAPAGGGVVFHCAGGRDRSGQIAMIVLALADVRPDEIARDYDLSAERLTARYAAKDELDQNPIIADFLAQRNTTTTELIQGTLDELGPSIQQSLQIEDATVAALRARLLNP